MVLTPSSKFVINRQISSRFFFQKSQSSNNVKKRHKSTKNDKGVKSWESWRVRHFDVIRRQMTTFWRYWRHWRQSAIVKNHHFDENWRQFHLFQAKNFIYNDSIDRIEKFRSRFISIEIDSEYRWKFQKIIFFHFFDITFFADHFAIVWSLSKKIRFDRSLPSDSKTSK